MATSCLPFPTPLASAVTDAIVVVVLAVFAVDVVVLCIVAADIAMVVIIVHPHILL